MKVFSELRHRLKIALYIFFVGFREYNVWIITHPVRYKGERLYELDGFLTLKYDDFHKPPPPRRTAKKLYRWDEV